MKKLVIAASIFSIFAGVNAQAASTGTVTFNGELTANTCEVKVAGQGPDATIVLPTISVNQLKTANQTAGKMNFDMALSGCSETVKGVSAFFEAGKDVNATTGRLNNSAAGGAKLVSLQLLDGANGMQEIKAGDASQSSSTTFVTAVDGNATLPYGIQYYAEGATTPGKVISIVDYSLNYK